LKICALDFESTGVDVATARVIEIGAALYDSDRRAVLATLAILVIPPSTEIPPEITELTGLTPEDLRQFGLLPAEAFARLASFVKQGEVESFVGHNCTTFDAPLLRAEIKRCVAAPQLAPLTALPWIDTISDLDPRRLKPGGSMRLSYLAADHGFLNPFPHRALGDCLTVLKILEQHPLDVVLERARSPLIVLEAVGTFEQNEAKKSLGFRWEKVDTGEVFPKKWVKLVKACDRPELEARAKELRLRLTEARRQVAA
jgi:DNA polymerase-3 subunit epsilon